jgi:hypothetical protein
VAKDRSFFHGPQAAEIWIAEQPVADNLLEQKVTPNSSGEVRGGSVDADGEVFGRPGGPLRLISHWPEFRGRSCIQGRM